MYGVRVRTSRAGVDVAESLHARGQRSRDFAACYEMKSEFVCIRDVVNNNSSTSRHVFISRLLHPPARLAWPRPAQHPR